MVPKFMNPAESPVILDENQISLLVSLSGYSQMIGSILSAVIATKYGTKTSLFFVGLLGLSTYLFLSIGDSIYSLFISKIFSGMSYGMQIGTIPLYIGEIGEPKQRALIFGVRISGDSVGRLLGIILGANLTIQSFGILGFFLALLFLITFYWLPKSPYYLIRINQFNDATKSMKFYRPKVDITSEIDRLVNFIDAKETLTVKYLFNELIMNRGNRILVIKFIILYALLQISGTWSMQSFVGLFFDKFEDKTYLNSATTIFSFAGSVLGMFINDFFRRKNLLCISSFIVAIMLMDFGFYYMLIDYKLFDENWLHWILICSMLTRGFFLCFGVVIICNVLLSELFISNVKCVSVCIVHIVSGSFLPLSIGLFFPLIEIFSYNIFFIYAFSMISVCIFVCFFIPETKDKDIEEIKQLLDGKN